jgi:GT2 family glycosyltransferase
MNNGSNLKISLKVVILSRNRPEYLRETLSSVIIASKNIPNTINFELEISDNSDYERKIKETEVNFSKINIISRKPILSFINHLKTVIKEANSDYLVIFHDDDLMKPNYLSELLNIINKNPDIIAVGCNAVYLKNDREIDKTFLKKSNKEIIIDTKEKILNGYFLIGGEGTAPLPSYMYKVSKIKNVEFNENNGGIHADVSLLFNAVEHGIILLTRKVLMSYRLHESNENKNSRVAIKLNLLNYLNRKISKKTNRALKDYRYTIMLEWFAGQNIKLINYYNWTNRQKFIFYYIIRELLEHVLFRPGCRSLHLKVFGEKLMNKISFKNIMQNIRK